MNRKQYVAYCALISAAVGAATGFSITSDKALVAVIFLLVGTGLIYLLRSKVKDVIEDEMIQAYAGKVSKKTMDIFGISLTILGLILLGYKKAYPGLEIAGYALLYSVCYMLVLYFFFYYFYTRNLTGNNNDDKK